MVVMGVNLATEDIVISIYGGTSWTQITDKFLIGASDTYTVSATGGNNVATPSGTNSGGAVQSHTLTTSEIPSHTHSVAGHNLYAPTGTQSNFEHYLGSGGLSYSQNTGSTGSGGGHSHGFTQPTFTGNSMSIINPYYAVYIWIRTA